MQYIENVNICNLLSFAAMPKFCKFKVLIQLKVNTDLLLDTWVYVIQNHNLS